jgi:transposase
MARQLRKAKPRHNRRGLRMKVEGLQQLFLFEGYIVDKAHFSEQLVHVVLRRDKRRRFACPDCGRSMSVGRQTLQSARDLALGPATHVILVYPAFQCYCPKCQARHTVRPPGIDAHAKATWRLMRFASQLCQHMPNLRVAEVLGVGDATVGRWDRRVLRAQLPEPDFDAVDKLLVDEKHLGSQFGYVTVVLDADTGEFLHMAPGKKKESLQSFFDRLDDVQKEGIVAVGIDRAGQYKQVVLDNCPNALIVYDRFHIMKNYNDAVDEVRRAELGKVLPRHKQLIKGQRYNLLRNPGKLSADAKKQLHALLAVNENLNTCYVLADALRHLWDYRYRKAAERYLDAWCVWAKESGIDALRRFAQSLQRSKEGILNYFHWPITQAKIESLNNTIARVQHRACGIKDMEYLKLKLRQQTLSSAAQT